MPRIVLILFLDMVALLVACTQLGTIKQKPEITLANIELVELGLLEQRFNLQLRIQNPNDVALRINGMTVDLELNGTKFAKGLSDKTVTVPRMSEAVMEVKATSSLGMLWQQLSQLEKSSSDKIDYQNLWTTLSGGAGQHPI
ncbi:LEA type 2 family protein [Nitrosomonas communis]|uniref:Late embryogenesis abundant protein n=1 Tax=Nitrosomonas communis TaxID=44574 RepID=A0A1I4QTD8_9PROT|nr:LEA type 2 family protein [Nitrosomonas communis]SFM42966.1 Late embryogenesis abundant protein [Nitrosomonas communis]